MVLRSRPDGAVELRVNGVFVMDTHEVETERALARIALRSCPSPGSLLVAGLGLGFTAHAVLTDPRVERLTIVEIEDAVVAWARSGLVPDGPALLADERVHVVVDDLRSFVRDAAPASFDAVLLDVDNGPDFLVHEGNAEIYEAPVLGRIRDLLTPEGVVVVWSSTRSERLLAALDSTFGGSECEAHPVDLQGRAETYHLHLAHRGG